MEAVLGAVYLDGGLPQAEKLIIPWLESQLPGQLDIDHKSILQEAIQKTHKRPPDYELMSETGPEHEKLFTVRVCLGKKTLGLGSGKNKGSPAGGGEERPGLSRHPRSAEARPLNARRERNEGHQDPKRF